MKFQIPQFIERETRIVGPLTFRQAGTLAAPIPVLFILFFMRIPLTIFLFIAVISEGMAVAAAIIKIGGKILPMALMDVFFFMIRPRTYVWKRGNTKLTLHDVAFEPPKRKKGEPEPKPAFELTRTSKIFLLSTKVQTRS